MNTDLSYGDVVGVVVVVMAALEYCYLKNDRHYLPRSESWLKDH